MRSAKVATKAEDVQNSPIMVRNRGYRAGMTSLGIVAPFRIHRHGFWFGWGVFFVSTASRSRGVVD